MKTMLAALGVAGMVAGGALVAAPTASAGCQGGWTPWGGGETCDGPVDANGWYIRCQSGGGMGFGGTNCFPLDSRVTPRILP